MTSKILVVDNYDSFVWNLVHYLAQIGAEVEVWRNDDPRFGELVGQNPDSQNADDQAPDDWADRFDGVLLSPGPGTPERAGVCVDLVRRYGQRLPIFGVCLGLQAIAVAFGGVVDRAPELLHGKVSQVFHTGVGVFSGLANPLTCTRYHSLAITSLPDQLEATAYTQSRVVMAVRHRELPVEAVQFHPESVLTDSGYQMLANWLVVCGDADAPRRAAGLAPLMTGS